MTDWVLYGATGYTGELLAEEAAKRGLTPVLAGRNAAKLKALGDRLKLPWQAVSLDDAKGLRALLEGKGAVLHAAGPFVDTSAPMADACLDTRCSYLDITGELPVFEALFARDGEAKEKGVALIPGVGFDVVPSDCLAVHVASKLPGADTLELALAAIGQPSAGTVKSLVGLLPNGGWVRRGGALVPHPIGKGVHPVRFSHRTAMAAPGPIADLVTAFHSTGIPNITVSLAVPSGVARMAKVGWPLGVVGFPVFAKLLQSKSVRARIDQRIEGSQAGPDAAGRATGRCYLHARVTAKNGTSAEGWLETAEGYEHTRHAAVSAVQTVLAQKPKGALSPAMAFGKDFVLGVPGTKRLDTL